METLGDRIHKLRKENNISQEELAFALNVTRQTISRWENNSVKPTEENLKILSDYFKTDILTLTNGDSEIATVTEVCEVEVKRGSPNQMSKRYLYIVISFLLLACIAVCIFTSVTMLSPIENPSINNRIAYRFNYIGIICVVASIVSFIILSLIWIIYFINRKKNKM